MNLFLNIIGAIIAGASTIFSCNILLNKKINFKSYKIYLSVFLLTIILLYVYNNVLKFALNVFLISIIVKYLFNQNLKISIITSFFLQTLGLIIEFIFAILLIFVLQIGFDSTNIDAIIILFADIFVGLGCILVSKLLKNLYNKILKTINNIKINQAIIAVIPIIFLFNSYIQLTYYKIDSVYIFLINNISVYIIVGVLLIFVKRDNDYIKINEKYNVILNSLKEYEDILDKYKILNHENKNQLLTIRNMVFNENKKVVKYIDNLVNNRIKDDEKLMHEVSIIPAGGLRGLIYSKILYMKENSIEYDLNISKKYKNYRFNK